MPRFSRRFLAFTAPVIVVLLALAMAEERGTAMGVVAGVFWAALFALALFAGGWFAAHRVIDRLVVASLVFFFALAYLTDLPLGVCAAIGFAGGVAMWLQGVARDRRGRAAGA